MSYFVKKTIKTKGEYYQIYDSSWDPIKNRNVSKCFKTLGYKDDLITNDIKDPLDYYSKWCKEENNKRKTIKRDKFIERLSDNNYKFNIGTSLIYNTFNSLNLNNEMKLGVICFGHSFPEDKIFLDLVACRIFNPASKSKTYNELMPLIYGEHNYSLENIYDTLDDLGSDYRGMIEIINHCLSHKYKADTSNVFFDCTNFYFEIDREDEIRRKGPSKENRRDPILGLGLLLDKNCMPIGMKMYPGNQSEKPIQRDLIEELKRSGNIAGRTIVVADKGLNCARNIHQAIKNNDGYIYSKSILQSSSMDKSWIFLDDDKHPESAYHRIYNSNKEVVFKIKSSIDTYTYKYDIKDENNKTIKTITFTSKEKRVVYFSKDLHDKKVYELNKIKSKLNDLILSKAKKEEYGVYSSYVNIKSESNDIDVSINEEKIEMELECAGYNMIITSEYKENDKSIYDTYHHLWRIEETFRIMKTDLDARPVYLQKENRIYGHFLVCYLAVVIIRFLQFVVFKNKDISLNEILHFIQTNEVIEIKGGEYMNTNKRTKCMDLINEVTKVNCDFKVYSKEKLDKMFNSKLNLD